MTDRPDFTESAQTVAPRTVQLEAGETFAREGDIRSVSIGEVLIRTGISSRAELRVSANSYLMERVGGLRITGMEDGALGVKLRLFDGSENPGPVPAISVIAGASIPSGAANQRSNLFLPETKLVAAWGLTDRLGFASNINWSTGDDAGRRYNEYSGTGSFAYSLSDRVGAYAEYFGFATRTGSAWEKRHYANGGLTFLFSPDLQLDARAGVGPRTNSRDFFAGVGISRRW